MAPLRNVSKKCSENETKKCRNHDRFSHGELAFWISSWPSRCQIVFPEIFQGLKSGRESHFFPSALAWSQKKKKIN